LRRWREIALVVGLSLCSAGWEPLWRTQPDIDDGIQAYNEKKWSEALSAYDEAAKAIPDTPELHLNRGDVHAQQALTKDPAERHELLGKAREEFQRALSFDAPAKKAAAFHNLATAVTESAIPDKKMEKGQVAPVPREERIAQLKTAIDGFKKALELHSEDEDTKFNMEVAQRLLAQLEEEQKKEDEQKKKEQEKNKEKQEKKDDQKQDPQQQDQKQDQQKQDQQKQDQQKQDQQKQDQQKQDQQKQDQQKQDQQKQDQAEQEKQKQKQEQQKREQQKQAEQEQQKQEQQKREQQQRQAGKQKKDPPLDLAPLEALKNSEKPLQLYRIMMEPPKGNVGKDW
jgi:Ca-activated chloride channel family protein